MAERLHIAQMVSGRVVNGAVRHCLMLCEALTHRGHAVTVLHRPQLQIGAELDAKGIPRLETTFPLSLGGFRATAERLTAMGVDVTHTHMSDAHTHGVAARLLKGVPTVATAHSSHLQLHWPFNDRV